MLLCESSVVWLNCLPKIADVVYSFSTMICVHLSPVIDFISLHWEIIGGPICLLVVASYKGRMLQVKNKCFIGLLSKDRVIVLVDKFEIPSGWFLVVWNSYNLGVYLWVMSYWQMFTYFYCCSPTDTSCVYRVVYIICIMRCRNQLHINLFS